MTALSALWLPILLSAVVVFVASSIIHMALPWHKSDYPALPDEERFRSAVKPLAIPPGDYFVPRANDSKEMKTPEFCSKLAEGPVVIMTVLPNEPFAMGRNLGMWFVFCLAVGLITAYAAGLALAPGTPYLRVFRLASVIAFAGYALALWPLSIWYRRAWSTTIKSTVDGLVYALLTAGVFGWLWPH